MKRKGARASTTTSRGFSGRTSFKAFHGQPTGSKTSHAFIVGTHVPEKAYGENPSGARVSAAETDTSSHNKSRKANNGVETVPAYSVATPKNNDAVDRDWQKNRVDDPYRSNSYGFKQQHDFGSVQGSMPRDRNGNFHDTGNEQSCGYYGDYPSSFPNSGPAQGYSVQESASFPTCRYCHSHQQELESVCSLNHTYHHHGNVNQGIAHSDMQPKQVSEVDCQCTPNCLHKRQYQQAAVELRSGHAPLPGGCWSSLPASTRSSFDSDGDLGYMSDSYSWSMISDDYKYSKWSYSEKQNLQAYADEGSGRDRFLTNPADSYLSMYYQHGNQGNYGVSDGYLINSLMVNNPRSNSQSSEMDLVNDFSRFMNLGSAKQSSS